MQVAAALDGEEQDVYRLKALVELGGEVNRPDELGNTALHVAIGCIRPRAVQFLLSIGGSRHELGK